MRETTPIRAVLFDLDGTLYHQAPLRALMALELARLPFAPGSLEGARRTWRALAAFRRVREELRQVGRPAGALERLQYERAAEVANLSGAALEALVDEWIYRRPLRYLRRCRRRGVGEALARLRTRRLRTGIFSDHPVDAKLEALDLREPVSLRLCATDPEINAFKPHPAGFLRACAVWELSPREVLYVGDRPEVDAAGAAAAGMPCAIVGRRLTLPGSGTSTPPFRSLSSVTGLEHAIDRVD